MRGSIFSDHRKDSFESMIVKVWHGFFALKHAWRYFYEKGNFIASLFLIIFLSLFVALLNNFQFAISYWMLNSMKFRNRVSVLWSVFYSISGFFCWLACVYDCWIHTFIMIMVTIFGLNGRHFYSLIIEYHFTFKN